MDRDRWSAAWLNIGCGHRRVIGNFLLKIADRDVERAAGEQIRRGIVVARLGKLPVGGGAGEIRKAKAVTSTTKARTMISAAPLDAASRE